MDAPPAAPLPRLNPLRRGFFEDPYAQYAELRRDNPVHSSMGMWVLTRYDDVRAALMNRALSVALIPDTIAELSARHPEAAGPELWEFARTSIVFSEGELHVRLKRAMMPLLAARTVEPWRALALEVARDAARALAGRPQADLVPEFAAEVPTRFLATLFGLSYAESAALAAAAGTIRVLLEPRSASPRQLAAGRAALAEGVRLFGEAAARVRAGSAEAPLLRALLDAAEAETGLAPDEIAFMGVMVYVAGHETTVGLIGNALHALLHAPGEFAALARDPARAGSVVRETLRFEPPLQLSVRRCEESVRFGGVTIEPGAALLLCIGSANRDESVFAAPERFDPDRAGPPHLAFGGGLHTCLGMFVATLEAEAALSALAETLAGAPPAAGPPRWSRRSMLLRALDALPVAPAAR